MPCGLLNVCSIAYSTDVFVDIVDNYKLDLFAPIETWLKANDHPELVQTLMYLWKSSTICCSYEGLLTES